MTALTMGLMMFGTTLAADTQVEQRRDRRGDGIERRLEHRRETRRGHGD